MLNVLVIIHSSTYFVELLRAARLLKRSDSYQPVLFFGYRYPTIGRDIPLCLREGLCCLDESGATITLPKEVPQNTPQLSQVDRADKVPVRKNWRTYAAQWFPYLPSPVQKFVRFLDTELYYGLLSSCWYFRRRFQLIRRILNRVKPSLVVLAGDNVGYDTSVYVKVAHENRIPAVLLPSTMSNGLEAAEVYYNDPYRMVAKRLNRIIAWLYPRWVREHKNRKLLAEPAGRILAMEWFGLAPPRPWIFNSGYADAIAAESEAMVQYYREGGLPAEQIVLTGSLANDELAENLRNATEKKRKLCHELNLPEDRPLILSALPPDFLYLPGGRPTCDFQVYDDLVKFWVQALATAKNCNVVICLHPSVPYQQMKYIEEWGVKIAKEATSDLIPLCDIYVASVSSTIRWAIACGKPVVNYDVYRYQYTDYLGVKAVIATEEKDEFLNILRRITGDVEFYKEMVAQQMACAKEWGQLDGQVGTRLLRLFDEQIKKYRAAPGPYTGKMEIPRG